MSQVPDEARVCATPKSIMSLTGFVTASPLPCICDKTLDRLRLGGLPNVPPHPEPPAQIPRLYIHYTLPHQHRPRPNLFQDWLVRLLLFPHCERTRREEEKEQRIHKKKEWQERRGPMEGLSTVAARDRHDAGKGHGDAGSEAERHMGQS